MKKESVNTFNEGLNYDLNTITTPNNVLVDNVNGTFITFNGDELALQNDAGNTKIIVPIENATEYNPSETYVANDAVYIIENGITKYYTNINGNNDGTLNPSDWSEEVVKLSEGFHPLGIKEYGGVLYIVSTDGTDIEFGSYPSPENYGQSGQSGDIDYNLSSPDKSNLFISATINDTIFRAGEYVKFDNNEQDTSNISYPVYNNEQIQNYVSKVYKVKLIQQLTNGYIDLSDDVWNQYAKFVKSYYGENLNQFGVRFWFDDNNFQYFCPNNYKGKLGIIVEVEPLTNYKLDYRTINFTNGKYEFEFKVSFTNLSEYYLNVEFLRFNYYIDGIQQFPLQVKLIKPVQNEPNYTATFNISLDNISRGKTLTYEITPIFSFSETNFVLNSNFNKFINNLPVEWTLKGSQDLSVDQITDNLPPGATSAILIETFNQNDGIYQPWNFKLNTAYTLSFWAKSSQSDDLLHCGYEDNLTDIYIDDYWTYYSFPFTPYSSGNNSNLAFYADGETQIFLTNIKLEYRYGNEPTDWKLSEAELPYLSCDLPDSYLNDFVINGSDLIIADFDNLVIYRELNNPLVCERIGSDYTNYQVVERLTLKDTAGHYLTNELGESNEPYQFYLLKEGAIIPTHSLGSYTINPATNLAVFNAPGLPLSARDAIISLIENAQVRFISDVCKKTSIVINTSRILKEYDKITVTQVANSYNEEIVLEAGETRNSFTFNGIQQNE